MASEYQQTTDVEIQDRVRTRYRDSIDQLKTLGFAEMCFFRESMKALGLSNGLLGPLGALAASTKEILRIGSDLSVSTFLLLMFSREYDTYVSPFGLGVKFYTTFTDGTFLITANFDSQAISDDREKIYKFARKSSIQAAWKHHRTWVADLTATGRQRNYQLSFDDFARLSCREESYMLKPKFSSTAMFGDVGSTTLGAVIFGAMLAAAVLLLLAIPNLLHALYPACWFVRNMGKPSWLQSIPIAVACIAGSWLLARIQKSTVLVDGIGTMHYGQSPLPDGRGFISTRWLVFMTLPILPVRSYQIGEEVSQSSAQKQQAMRPLDRLHGAQIRGTLWHFKWWYALVILLWLGLGAWTLSQCI